MSELKAYIAYEADDFPDETEFYLKSEADKAIAELKGELKDVADGRNEFKQLYSEQTEKLCIEMTNVDTLEQEFRKTQRALWISRAKAYHYIAELITCFSPKFIRNRRMFIPNDLKQKQMNSLECARLMLKVESKCLAKAEEYK